MAFQFNDFRNFAVFAAEQIESINSFFLFLHLKRKLSKFAQNSNEIIGTLSIAFCQSDEYLEKVNKLTNTFTLRYLILDT